MLGILQQRWPSSVVIDMELETNYQKLIIGTTEQTKSHLLNSLQMITNGFFRAEALRADFDKELDEQLKRKVKDSSEGPESVGQLKSYPTMLAIWHIRDSLENKLLYYHKRLLLSSVGYDGPAKVKAAKVVLNEFYKNLVASNSLDRFALGDVYRKIQEQNVFFLSNVKQVLEQPNEKEESKAADLSVLPLKNEALFARDNVDQVRAKAEAVRKTNDSVKKDLERLTPIYRDILKVHFNPKRLPQQAMTGANIRPGGVGTDGNITGNSFPVGTWALTFDDGPHGLHTLMVLKNLEDNLIPATFFELTENVIALPAVAGKIVASRKNSLANHSYTHPQIPKLDTSGMQKEIVQAGDELAALWNKNLVELRSRNTDEKRTSLRAKFFRLPYGDGVNNEIVRNIIRDADMVHVFWNVDTLDWQDKNPDSILARTWKEMRLMKKGIILFHDIHPQSVAASKLLMEKINFENRTNAAGLKMVTVPEAVYELNCPDVKAHSDKPNCPDGMWYPFYPKSP